MKSQFKVYSSAFALCTMAELAMERLDQIEEQEKAMKGEIDNVEHPDDEDDMD